MDLGEPNLLCVGIANIERRRHKVCAIVRPLMQQQKVEIVGCFEHNRRCALFQLSIER